MTGWIILVKSVLSPSSPASWWLLSAPQGAHPWECWQSPLDDWFPKGSFDSLPLDHTLLLNSTNCQLILPCLQQYPEAPTVSQPNIIKLGSFQRMFPNVGWNLFWPQESPSQLSLSPISVLQTSRSPWLAFLCAMIWSGAMRAPVFSVVLHPRQSCPRRGWWLKGSHHLAKLAWNLASVIGSLGQDEKCWSRLPLPER